MTKREWEILWWEEFRKLRSEFPTQDLAKVQKAAHKYMTTRYGECPPDEPGPTWWMKIGAVTAGVPMEKLTQFWDLMNGKKTIVGAAITLFAYLVAGVPLVAALCTTTVCAATVAKVGGIGLTILGLAHKAYKLIYREEHN